MLRMDFDITIGKYRLKMVDSVKVKHSVEQLSDTATVTLPAMVEGKALEVEDKLKPTATDNVPVTIKLGYDGKLETEFEGYLKAVNTDNGNLTLECVGEEVAKYVANSIKSHQIAYSQIVIRCDYIERESNSVR